MGALRVGSVLVMAAILVIIGLGGNVPPKNLGTASPPSGLAGHFVFVRQRVVSGQPQARKVICCDHLLTRVGSRSPQERTGF